MAGTDDASRQRPDQLLVVGIGASAGGIAALKQFFAKVTPHQNTAYVVILHLSPDRDSQLAEILQLTAPLPVRQVTDRTPVQPDHVYVIPPNKSLAIMDGTLVLSDFTLRGAATIAGGPVLSNACRGARIARRLRRSLRHGRQRFGGARSWSRNMAVLPSSRIPTRPSTRTCPTMPSRPAWSIWCCRSRKWRRRSTTIIATSGRSATTRSSRWKGLTPPPRCATF